MNIKAPVDGEKQPSAENDMAAPDFPESSASSPEEEGVKAKVAEADTKPAVVSGVKDTVVEVVVPVELDEAVSGEWRGGLGSHRPMCQFTST